MLSQGTFSPVPTLGEPVAPVAAAQGSSGGLEQVLCQLDCQSMGTEDAHSLLARPHTCACQASSPLVSRGTSVSCLVAFRPMGAAGPPSLWSLGGGMSPQDHPVGQSWTLAGCAWLCVSDNVLSLSWVPSHQPWKSIQAQLLLVPRAPNVLQSHRANQQKGNGSVTFVIIPVTAPGLGGTGLHPQPCSTRILSIPGVTSGILGALKCSLGCGFLPTHMRSKGFYFGCFKLHFCPPMSVCVQEGP